MDEEKLKINEDISRDIERTSIPGTLVANGVAEKEEKIAKSVTELPIIKDELEERKRKFIGFLKNSQTWVVAILIIALILGVYIRSMPMKDHGGQPGLWDVTTGTWTLGPDLDPWLFLRYAEAIVEEGSIPEMDNFRNVPLGYSTKGETKLLPYMISWTYYFFHAFDETVNIEYAAAIFPVIMFAFTIITFFLFVREIFIRNSKKSILNANIIASISTFFMIVMPAFLSRTIAGIPEKESAGFFFMFLSLYLFLKAWKSEKINKASIFAILAGISTAGMSLIWGGNIYLFIPIGGATFLALFLDKIEKKEFIIYSLWVLVSFSLMNLLSGRFPIIGLTTSLGTGVAFLTLIVLITHFAIWKTKLSKIPLLKKIGLPKNVISIIIAFVFLFLLSVIFLGPSFVFDKIKAIHQTIFKPIFGRWNTTVAENRQPDYKEWIQSFGPFVKDIPLFFWMFFIGSVVLFKKTIKKIRNKEAWILTGLYLLFLVGMIFSRYSSSSILNGENFISTFFYYSTALLFAGFLIHYYIQYYKKGDESFKKLEYEYILLLTLFVLTLFTARGAIRLLMVLAIIAPILVSFLIVESITKFMKTKEETFKLILGIFSLLILISSIFAFTSYYNEVKVRAYNFVPSYYNQQWQKAMEWVRDETPTDSVFGHWWDYGYWVQSIGKRATVLDGGNAIAYWNYLMGRHVLTGDNQDDALEYLYNHNTTHLLIDSTDIGKYGAYSSIGSDKDFDRYSWFGTFVMDETQTQETKNQTLLFYRGGTALDEDTIIEEDGKEILLPAQKTGIGAVVVPLENSEGTTGFGQPYAYLIYNNKQYQIQLKYLAIGGELISFDEGVEACAYIIPNLQVSGEGASNNPMGAMLFISERQLRGLFSQIYLLKDPFENFPNFELVHVEKNLIIESLNAQGLNLPEIIYYQGLQGPIKIWEVEYTGKEKIKKEYLDTDANKYLDWKL